MKPFRVFFRSIRDSFKSIFRNFSLSMASVVCTTITLILVALAIIVTVNVNYVTDTLEHELTIVVYVNSDVNAEGINRIEDEIKGIKRVEEVSYKSKDEWRMEMKNYSDTLNATLDYLTTNPLLDSFTVKVKEVEDLSKVKKEILKIEGIETADYGEGMVEDIVSIFNIIKMITVIMVLSLIVVTAFLISNTIKLTIFSRRNEIEIMRLVGSSNIAIKLPFIFEGFLLGIIGSLIPIIITVYGYIIAYEKLGGKLTFGVAQLIKPIPFVFVLSLGLLFIGSVVGMFGSSRAVRKYLKI